MTQVDSTSLFCGLARCFSPSRTLDDLPPAYPAADGFVAATLIPRQPLGTPKTAVVPPASCAVGARAAAMAMLPAIAPRHSDAICAALAWNPVSQAALATWGEPCLSWMLHQPRLQRYPNRSLQLITSWAQAHRVPLNQPSLLVQIPWLDLSNEAKAAYLDRLGLGNGEPLPDRLASAPQVPEADSDATPEPEGTRLRLFIDAPQFITPATPLHKTLFADGVPVHLAMKRPWRLRVIQDDRKFWLDLPTYDPIAPVRIDVHVGDDKPTASVESLA